jgi:hypothetical protein
MTAALAPVLLLTLGARIGPQSIYLEGDGAPSDLRGYVAGVDAAVRLSRNLSIAGVFEGSLYDRRSDRLEPGPAAMSAADTMSKKQGSSFTVWKDGLAECRS